MHEPSGARAAAHRPAAHTGHGSVLPWPGAVDKGLCRAPAVRSPRPARSARRLTELELPGHRHQHCADHRGGDERDRAAHEAVQRRSILRGALTRPAPDLCTTGRLKAVER